MIGVTHIKQKIFGIFNNLRGWRSFKTKTIWDHYSTPILFKSYSISIPFSTLVFAELITT